MKENILNLFLIITTSLIITVLGIYIFKTTKNNTKPDDYYNNLPVYYKDYLYMFDTVLKKKLLVHHLMYLSLKSIHLKQHIKITNQ